MKSKNYSLSLNISDVEDEINEMKNDKYMEKYSNILELVIKEFEKEKLNEK